MRHAMNLLVSWSPNGGLQTTGVDTGLRPSHGLNITVSADPAECAATRRAHLRLVRD